MPRLPRIYIPDVSVHVFSRGINRAAIVAADDDRDRLRFNWDCHAYCVMTTHYHLIVTPSGEGALARTMQNIGESYTRYFNRKYERIGTIWNERYSAIPLDDERYFYNCLRYVELNPMAANMVVAPETYRWSSYRVHALGVSCAWLTPHPLYLALGPTPEIRQAAYRAMCAIPLTDQELALQRHPPPRSVIQLPAEV